MFYVIRTSSHSTKTQSEQVGVADRWLNARPTSRQNKITGARGQYANEAKETPEAILKQWSMNWHTRTELVSTVIRFYINIHQVGFAVWSSESGDCMCLTVDEMRLSKLTTYSALSSDQTIQSHSFNHCRPLQFAPVERWYTVELDDSLKRHSRLNYAPISIWTDPKRRLLTSNLTNQIGAHTCTRDLFMVIVYIHWRQEIVPVIL